MRSFVEPSVGPRRLRRYAGCLLLLAAAAIGGISPGPMSAEAAGRPSVRVALDFNEVELPVFVRFMSELTGKNFVLDEGAKKAAGRITVFSPTRVTVDQAYNIFLATLEVARLSAVPHGNVIQIVQMAEAPPAREVFVYHLKHANAVDTATMLSQLVAKSQAQPIATGTRPPIRPPGEFDAPVQVFADKPTNSLLITGTRSAYERLQAVIRSLDVRRRQVFLETVILEVELDRLRQIGTDPSQGVLGLFQVKGSQGTLNALSGFNGQLSDIASVAQALSGSASGAAPALNSVNVRAFLQLLLTFTDTNILSTPQVLASDNQKAKIIVGENRPFPTGQAQGITGGTLVTIDRKDVGVTLEMTPQVLEEDLVRLDVKQEITAIEASVPQTIGTGNASVPVGPTITKRAMETVAVAHDQGTIVVGGLVRDNVVVNENKVPLLGDIPLLGWLFRSQSKQTQQLTLLVFLTPRIIKDEADVAEVNVRKAIEMQRAQRGNRIDELTGVKRETAERLLPNGTPDDPASPP